MENQYFEKFDELVVAARKGECAEYAVAEFVDDAQYKADCGDADAQFFIWATQCDVRREPERAYELISESALSGNHDAEFILGTMYERGSYVKKNDETAVRLYRLAAKGGNPLAMRKLGDCYLHGVGVEKDVAKARLWCNEAETRDGADIAEISLRRNREREWYNRWSRHKG